MQRASTIFIILIGLMWLDLTVSKSIYESQLLHYNPINGDFQTYNPLRRMAAGENAGKDFQPYMGLGITYATYLPFAVMGKTFAASKFSAQLMHMWLFGLGSFVLFLLLRFKWQAAFSLAFLTQLYAILCTDYLELFQMDWGVAETALPFAQTLKALSHAENSCLGIRVALPILTAGLMLLIYKRFPNLSGNKEAIVWGAIAGAQVPWSNDYGLTSMAVLSVCYILFLSRSWKQRGIHIAALIIGAIVIFTLATNGYPLRALGYNFGGVAKDQFWYFMLDDVGKVFSLMQYVKAKRIFILAAISAIFMTAIFAYLLRCKKRDVRDILFFYILATALAAGLLSTIGGGIMERYFSASLRLLPFAALWVWLRVIGLPKFSALPIVTFAVGIIFYVIMSPISIANVKEEVAVKTSGRYFYSEWAGGYLPNSQKKEIELAKKMEGKTVFSTYSSLMDAASVNFQPSGIDYIIHALGRESRASYLASFAESKPNFVTTPNELWTLWEVWSRRVNWWFYREMIRDYVPIDTTEYHVIWQKRSKPLDVTAHIEDATCSIKNNQLHVADTLKNGTYYIELEVGFDVALESTDVPLIGNRALLTIEEQSSGFNAVLGKHIAQPDIRTYNVDYTLNPQQIVVEHVARKPSDIYLHIAPKDRAKLHINSCKINSVYAFPSVAFRSSQ